MQIHEELEHARQDARYFWAHWEELVAAYPDRWVAIYDKELVASAEQLPDLLARVDEQGVPRGRVFIEYLSTNDQVLVLSSS